MSKGSVNKVILIGRLGNEPDVRYTPAGVAVANISVATNFSVKDKQTGEWRDETEWHRVALFERTAETAKQYLHKGSKVYIEGRLRTNKWQDQQGQDRYTTEIIGREMQMLDSRSEGAGSYGGAQGYGAQGAGGYGGAAPASPYGQQQPSHQASPPPNQGTQPPPQPAGAEGMNQAAPPPPDKDFDQDVPF